MKEDKIIQSIKEGKIFIYPTDTIYGLGCDATNKEAVEKIKEIKKREKNKPLSIIAPNKSWINQNCLDPYNSVKKYLPGPYTLILKKKNPDFLKWVSKEETIGIRIPKHDFCKLIQQSGLPFITTSVNLSGEHPALSIKEIDNRILEKADHIIEPSPNENLSGVPSTLVISGKEIQRK